MQNQRLKALYAEHSSAMDCFDVIAEELAAGFSGGQVKRQLRQLGEVASKAGRRRRVTGPIEGGGSGLGVGVLGGSDSEGWGEEAGGGQAGAKPASPKLGDGGGFSTDPSGACTGVPVTGWGSEHASACCGRCAAV